MRRINTRALSLSERDFRNMDSDTSIDTRENNVVESEQGNKEQDYELDSADREVEELFSLSLKLRQENSLLCDSVSCNRPSAPVPRSECFYKHDRDSECDFFTKTVDHHSCAINYPRCKHTRNLDTRGPCTICYFRPINNSCSTGMDCRTSSKGTCSVTTASRSTSCQFPKGNLVQRQRSMHSTTCGSLPDVVPSHPERPTSLPDIATLRQRCENETGRELRRIGDEFEALFRERNTRKVQTVSWSLFNCSLTFHLSGYLHTIRRFLSPSPQETMGIR